MDKNELSFVIIGAAIEVHQVLGGPGLLESVYEEALAYELELRGIPVDRQLDVPIIYKGKLLSKCYRLDLLVNKVVIVECKAIEVDHEIYQAQCLIHLRLTDKRLGLVINFGQKRLKDGIHRVVNKLSEN